MIIYCSKNKYLACQVELEGDNIKLTLLHCNRSKFLWWTFEDWKADRNFIIVKINENECRGAGVINFVGGGRIEFWPSSTFNLEERIASMFKDWNDNYERYNRHESLLKQAYENIQTRQIKQS